MARHSLNYVFWKQLKGVAADLKMIYSAPTIEEAEYHLEQFEEKWNCSHPIVGKSWRSNWERITPFFSYPNKFAERSTRSTPLSRSTCRYGR